MDAGLTVQHSQKSKSFTFVQIIPENKSNLLIQLLVALVKLFSLRTWGVANFFHASRGYEFYQKCLSLEGTSNGRVGIKNRLN